MSQFFTLFSAKAKWQLYRLFDDIALMGRLALLTILISTVLFFTNWRFLQNQMAGMIVDSVNFKPKADVQQNQNQLLEGYLVQFPKLSDKAQTFNAFMQIAKEHELTLDTVTYKTKPNENTAPLSQTMMEFTLYATYTQAHDFVNKVMVEMPYVAIEQLSFNRANDQDELIEARIRLLFNFVQN